ncbi:MAG: Flp pilus assembly protein TadG [Mariniblastus sp.]|jgi:Flp pilus assembly protein TadG
MRKSLRNARRETHSRKGVATVEMAMVAPVIFLMIFGSVEFARMMMVRQALTNAAREGCRSACLATTNNDSKPELAVRDALLSVVKNSVDNPAIRVTIDPPMTSTIQSGTAVSVSVEVNCSDVSWLPPFFTAGAKIRGSSEMRKE